MLAPALRVLASVAALLALALAEEFCNIATIGDFGGDEESTLTKKASILTGKQILDLGTIHCLNYPWEPLGLRVTACDQDQYPQVHLLGMSGRIIRLGKLYKAASVNIAIKCNLNAANADSEMEYV